ncbi:MAG: hypothetical protein D6753_16575 [Planctomycetota bacterium]|nr:MAG: hypothetical protein D6753_16575 [Planctomycetota bacterium]
MAASDDNWLQGLLSAIPGYGAYREQQSRRDDDAATRAFLAKRLGDVGNRLTRVMAAAAQRGDIELPHRLESLRTEVERAQNRLRAAVAGYASWFDQREVNAELLDQIARHDESLVSLVDQLDKLAAGMESPTEDQISEFREVVDLLMERIDRRDEILRG